ncbi:MAG TPA: hypothetical protein PK014_06600 [Thermoanaerobaculia bacterium]|nr:hypothetical protein [Thermoanaerobaculia bacterium]HUM29422.1 hypothetical protein [Thermoanaerobaculia bacterium]HXK67668.1 hypothetical protein [Thermoanaerobaculia bacterium]
MHFSYYGPGGGVQTFTSKRPSVTIGSAVECDLVLEGLSDLHCRVYLSEQGYYALDNAGDLCINNIPGSGYLKNNDAVTMGPYAFRFNLIERPEPEKRERPDIKADPVVRPQGLSHRPGLALVLAFLIPGWGQAYNGQPVKALFLMLLSILVIPWIYSIVDAHKRAKRIMESGGRRGRGGWLWITLHAWLAVNVAMFTMISLTVAGVIQ